MSLFRISQFAIVVSESLRRTSGLMLRSKCFSASFVKARAKQASTSFFSGESSLDRPMILLKASWVKRTICSARIGGAFPVTRAFGFGMGLRFWFESPYFGQELESWRGGEIPVVCRILGQIFGSDTPWIRVFGGWRTTFFQCFFDFLLFCYQFVGPKVGQLQFSFVDWAAEIRSTMTMNFAIDAVLFVVIAFGVTGFWGVRK